MAKKKTKKKKATKKKTVATIKHTDEKRTNIPTAEQASVVADADKEVKQLKYPRNPDLDPQLVWRGKDEQDWSDLVVGAPPLYIQEKVHPKVLIDDLLKETKKQDDRDDKAGGGLQLDLFGDFNGLPDEARSTEFYQHEANWTNRMILGDSLQVMASLAEREGLRGKVQCIYIDPPYGIKFNSNFQWSTTSRDVKDGKSDHITREPEQVKAFRDTWRDGIHSYLTYLRDRLTVARDLLSESGSIFVQIGDENVHRVRGLLDEVFGEDNFCATINFQKTAHATSDLIPSITDSIVWYAKSKKSVKYRSLYRSKERGDPGTVNFDYIQHSKTGVVEKLSPKAPTPPNPPKARWRVFRLDNLMSVGFRENTSRPFTFRGRVFETGPNRNWKTTFEGLDRLVKAHRLEIYGNSLCQIRYLDDFPVSYLANIWSDTVWPSFGEPKTYVVQTLGTVVRRCVLMTTDPGDLVLDPTCGSGTTANEAERWGRRWITMDTSRVALALARARIMGARYPYYVLSDSKEGQQQEAELARTAVSDSPTHSNIRHGFVYERVPHIMLSSVAHNAEIDVIWEQFQEKLEPLREDLNKALKQKWEEWEIPREAEEDWTDKAQKLHDEWWKLRIERQQEIDASIAAKADFEYLYDRPYEDKSKVRVAGPFTVESLSPHRTLGVDENDELIDPRKAAASSQATVAERKLGYGHGVDDFVSVILENLKTSGVQQSAKEDKINFTTLTGWPGEYICAEAQYTEGRESFSDDEDQASTNSDDAAASEDGKKTPDPLHATEKRAGIFIGPEFGTVARADLVAAAREAADAGFDVLIACAFNYDAHSSEFDKLGKIPVLKARMNADLHMADDLKNTGKGNLFVIFGEPDIDILEVDGQFGDRIQVKINGVDVFKPNTGEVQSDSTDGIACWFIDTDYNEESFFVRHAYFLGAGDPYKSLKTTLKAEINEEAWATLNSDTSRPFRKPKSGRIAVKVINHLGDEVMKVFRVE